MPHNNIPKKRRKYVTYGWIFVYYIPPKDNPYLIRIKVGGNLIKYPGKFSTRTSDVTKKFNSTISNIEVQFMCSDIKNFFW